MTHPNHISTTVKRAFARARAARRTRKPANIARHPALIEALAKRGRTWGEGNPNVLQQIRELQAEWVGGKMCVPSGSRPAPGWTTFYRRAMRAAE